MDGRNAVTDDYGAGVHPPLVGAGGAPWYAVTGPDEELRVGAARADGAVGPAVIVSGQLDRHAEYGPGPQRTDIRARLFVTAEHGRMQTVPADTQAVDKQLAAPAQTLWSLIIVQRPGAEHLEHGQMPVIANLVKIGRAQAVLHTGQPPVLRVGQALQVPGQRVHPRGGEQHRTRRYFDRQGDAELAVLHHSIAVNSQTDAQRRFGDIDAGLTEVTMTTGAKDDDGIGLAA